MRFTILIILNYASFLLFTPFMISSGFLSLLEFILTAFFWNKYLKSSTSSLSIILMYYKASLLPKTLWIIWKYYNIIYRQKTSSVPDNSEFNIGTSVSI